MRFHHRPLRQIKKTGRKMESLRKRAKGAPQGLDKFVSEQNIARYRKLIDAETDENQRRMILQLLAEQVAELRDR
jgi:hypothetical protein